MQVQTGIPIVSIEAVKITATIEVAALFLAIATVIREAIALQAIADLPHLQVTRQDQTIIGEAVLQEAAIGIVRLMTAALQATIGTILHIMAMVLQQITAEALRLHDAYFLTDSRVLVLTARSDLNATKGPWQIRAIVSQV